jgi:hypothetical protein
MVLPSSGQHGTRGPKAHGSRNVQTGRRLPGAAPSEKMAVLAAPPSLGRKRPRKADSATRGRIAAVHNVCGRIVRLQGIFCGAAFTKDGHGPPALVAILRCTAASLGSNVRTPPSRRGVVVVRPAWARSWRCKSFHKLTTANEAKRNCMRATECGEEARSEAAGRWTRTGYEAVLSRASGQRTAKPSWSRRSIVNPAAARRRIAFLPGEISPHA